MSQISSRTKSDSRGSCNSKNRAVDSFDRGPTQSGQTITRNDLLLIQTANKKKKLFIVLRQYGIEPVRSNQYSEWSNSIICPFPSHKGGNERSASFGYNFVKDTFHCFGCNMSGGAVEFISLKEGLSRNSVAEQILYELGGYDLEDDDILEDENPKIEKSLYDFSNYILLLYQKHKRDKNIIDQINKIIWWFDHYLIAKAPKNKIIINELEERILKAKELLEDFE